MIITLKPNSYLGLKGWQVTELKLRNTQLLVYAMVYNFTQHGKYGIFIPSSTNKIKDLGLRGWLDNSINYICEWCRTTPEEIQDTLSNLVEKKLLLRNVIQCGDISFNEYKINMEYVPNLEIK